VELKFFFLFIDDIHAILHLTVLSLIPYALRNGSIFFRTQVLQILLLVLIWSFWIKKVCRRFSHGLKLTNAERIFLIGSISTTTTVWLRLEILPISLVVLLSPKNHLLLRFYHLRVPRIPQRVNHLTLDRVKVTLAPCVVDLLESDELLPGFFILFGIEEDQVQEAEQLVTLCGHGVIH